MTSKTFDFIIAGAGIVGLSTAYKLSLAYPDASILILEKEPGVAAHQTGHNSGVIHSGIYYKPGSYKAKNCVDGRHQLVDFCLENEIKMDICGKVIVATQEEEIPGLTAIFNRGLQNEIEGLNLIDSKELRELEPHAAGLRAIHVPCAGIVDFKGVCEVLAAKTVLPGNRILFNSMITGVHQSNGSLTISASGHSYTCKHFINCTGLHSDRVARASGVDTQIKIVPFRGEYFKLTSSADHLVKGLIYPIPNPDFPFLGVHFTRMVLGGVECGPNAVFAFKREGYTKMAFNFTDTIETVNFPGFWKLAGRHWKMGLDEMYRSVSRNGFLKNLQKLIPSVQIDDLKPAPAGVRAMALDPNGNIVDDFFFETTDNEIHVLNAPSPAATAGLSIGDEIVNKAKQAFSL
ncbi:MAG: L-2-hydroxyglutarate oxidase [Balneolaceae bacterium]|nr:MAG: L-2-hydroxyglutarate oxidase [Balneolaceae bacterium]